DHDRLTLWDPDRGEHLLDVPVPSLAEDLAVSSDGLTLAVLGEEPAVLLIPLRPPLQGLPAAGLARQLQLPTRRLEGTAIVEAPLDAWGDSSQGIVLNQQAANLGFEQGEPGKAPPGWLGTAVISAER